MGKNNTRKQGLDQFMYLWSKKEHEPFTFQYYKKLYWDLESYIVLPFCMIYFWLL